MTPQNVVIQPSIWRRRVLLACWMGAAVVVGGRAAQIQVVEASDWRAIAEDQHSMDKEIVAARGTILDRDGTPLAVSRERFAVAVAYDQLRDPDVARDLLLSTLEVSPSKAAYLTSGDRGWAVAPGRYPPTVREKLRTTRGIHVERELQRYRPHGDLARGVLGVVLDDKGRGGVEQAFEEVLAGEPGREVVARDHLGRQIPGERITVAEPRAGGEVVLTIDMDLQEIARQSLQEAIAENGARGGDALVTDPYTGEILALVSIREGQTASLSAINTPYEPGSTLKPFTVAGLLDNDLASLRDSLDLENGAWRVRGRTLHDVVRVDGKATLEDALRQSSNIGIAKAAEAMTPGQQFENLRDFGFGTSTGIEIPGEVSGTLRRPDRWSGQSPASLAIGYEINVTPLQMAMAYGALANGGTLMQPRLVREVRDASGNVIERHDPEPVRRVVDERVARRVSRVLEDVVSDGTGSRASLGTFRVAGKSGTARLYSPEGGYEKGAYWASFVGFFPADDPQLVVFVKLERPADAYYGGAVAAPVTRATMEAALAARATPLDRAALLASAPTRPRAVDLASARFASTPLDPPAPPVDMLVGDDAELDPIAPISSGVVPVPVVEGLSARTAARRLHALGLRVMLPGSGEISGSIPTSGTRVLPGDTIRLLARAGSSHD